jgi:hypothetical protein
MRQPLLLPFLFLALAPAAHAADSPAGLELEICRLPGMPAEYSGHAIDIPAGIAFSATTGIPDAADPAQAPVPPVTVTLTAPATIAAAGFCVRAPIAPGDTVSARALGGHVGDMFQVSRGLPGTAHGTLDTIYGLLREKGE